MAKNTPRVGRPAKSAVAPGIFLRGKTYWLRYSAGGEQIRISLETEDPGEAIRRAEERRGRKITAKKSGRVIGGKTQLERDSEKYQEAKKAAGKFTDGTAHAAGQAIKNFIQTMDASDAAEITTDRIATLERHYMHLDSNADDAAESFRIEQPPPSNDPFDY